MRGTMEPQPGEPPWRSGTSENSSAARSRSRAPRCWSRSTS